MRSEADDFWALLKWVPALVIIILGALWMLSGA
jgi:hypothetical protein